MTASLPAPCPATKTSRERRPPEAVSVTGRFAEGVTPDQLPHGSAILEIIDAKTECFYWVEAVGRNGRVLGVWLQEFGDGTRHYVHLDGEVCCTCEDATYRPDRPGGCRHVVALGQALPELASRLAAVAA